MGPAYMKRDPIRNSVGNKDNFLLLNPVCTSQALRGLIRDEGRMMTVSIGERSRNECRK